MAEVTNYIDRLVAELCPDGVDFYTIDELITLDFGTRITKSKDAGTIYPVYGGGGASFRTDNYNREDKYVVSRFAMSEKCVRYVSGKFWMLDSGFTYSVKDESLLSYKYISYWLLNAQQEIYACSSQSAQRNLKTAEFKRFEVPVPPLEIQEAIVEILDKFTNMEAELEAELEARTLQYEYYRGSLFGTLKDPATGLPAIAGLVKTLCPDGVEYRSLKDVVAKNYGGGTPSKSKAEYWDGNIPWASVGDLSDDVLEVTDTRSKITEEGVKGSSTNIVPAGAVIVAIKINPGRMKIAGMNLAINQDIRGLVLNDSMNARFLTYYFRTLMFAGHGTIVKSITNKHLMETKIPVPPMEIQQRIVDILDRFDALTSSLSEGLPAELAARRSQYEYYRDQLLTFPRKGENQ